LLYWILLSFCSNFAFCPTPTSSQIKLNKNHQNKHSRDCEDNLPSYTLPNFPHKDSIDNMGHGTWPNQKARCYLSPLILFPTTIL
jgi:hypothetical protein